MLTGAELHSLVARAAALQRQTEDLNGKLREAAGILVGLARQEREVADNVRAIEARLTRATRTFDEHDRLLHRRGHHQEIARARADRRSLPDRLAELAETRERLAAATDQARASTDEATRRKAALDRDDGAKVSNQLLVDARDRGEHAARRPPAWLTEEIGPVPDDPDTRDRWITAAGRIAQHQALPHEDRHHTLTDPALQQRNETEAFTRDAAQRAVAELDEVRQHLLVPQISDPVLSL